MILISFRKCLDFGKPIRSSALSDVPRMVERYGLGCSFASSIAWDYPTLREFKPASIAQPSPLGAQNCALLAGKIWKNTRQVQSFSWGMRVFMSVLFGLGDEK